MRTTQRKFLMGRISQSESRGFSGCVSLHGGRGRLTNVLDSEAERTQERGKGAGRGDGSKCCGEIVTGGTEGEWKPFVQQRRHCIWRGRSEGKINPGTNTEVSGKPKTV